jgi:hypothetical protein
MNARTSVGFVSAIVLTLGFGASSAQAFIAKPVMLDAAGFSAVTPVAMCGRSCRGGGRYIQGPPSVCEQYDLNYCGPSRRGPEPGAGVYVPGTGIGVGVGPGGPGVYVAPGGSNCRTVTIERDDGTVRRIRRCD